MRARTSCLAFLLLLLGAQAGAEPPPLEAPPAPAAPGGAPAAVPPPVAPAAAPAPAPVDPGAGLPAPRYVGPDEVRARLEAIVRPGEGRRHPGSPRHVRHEHLGPPVPGAPDRARGGAAGPGPRRARGPGRRRDRGRARVRGAPRPARTGGGRRRPAGAEAPTAGLGYLVIPAPHPDGLASFLAGKGWPHGGPDVDRDLDGRAGEDGPDDLDGDGEVLWMRRKLPEGTFVARRRRPPKDGKVFGDPRLLKDAGVDARRAVSYGRRRPRGQGRRRRRGRQRGPARAPT